MGNFIDMTGKRFGRLVVLNRYGYERKGNEITWLCQCDCGERIVTAGSSIRDGQTSSCGCLSRMLASKRLTKHGAYGTPEYQSWAGMIQRCTNVNDADYENYGGRGIKVCPQWRNDFPAFLRYMGRRPKGTSIDRINNDGDYEPSNCRWGTHLQQANNRRPRRFQKKPKEMTH